MPQIIPIRDLKNTSDISERCHQSHEPIFVTKNGYGDMVVMSIETFERTMAMHEVYRKLEEAEEDLRQGRTISAEDSLRGLREKYGL